MRMTELLKEMTLEEKIGQLIQLTPSFFQEDQQETITGPIEEIGIDEEKLWAVGSLLGISSVEQVLHIQKLYLDKNRLKIPLLFMADVIHGYRTIFPVPLALASTWNEEMIEKVACVSAKEATAAGIHVTFSPMADLVRDPRWGRVMESTGEDPLLNGMLAAAFVRGYQGNDLKNQESLASCVKHFAAYGAPEGGRDYNTVDMSERELRESYLPAYKKALDAGAKLVMTSFNTVDGIPATGNEWLMRGVLRKEWGFDGVLISDWTAVKELIPHGVAEDLKDAARLAITAGVDIEMMSGGYSHHLDELITAHEVDERLLDEAVLRILKLKQELGLFENPYRGATMEREREVLLHADHRLLARKAAEASAVLLKNESVLPLSKGQTIALVGPFATSLDVLGPWAGTGRLEEAVTMEQGLKQQASRLLTASGVGIEERLDWDQAMKHAEAADVIVAALGEASWMSGEAGSLTDIRLPRVQRDFLAALKETGKPIVVVLFNGRPLDLRDVTENADAILEAWYPGTEAGHAIANLLYGVVNPSGRLTMSFPYHVGQVPLRYDHHRTGRPYDLPNADPRYVSKYLDAPNEPLFPFGYGLSYGKVHYGTLSLDRQDMSSDEKMAASIEITNTGEQTVMETVQWYVRDHVGQVVRPVKQLIGFEHVSLLRGETKTVTFHLDESMLRYVHSNLKVSSDPGRFTLFVGPNSVEVQEASFILS